MATPEELDDAFARELRASLPEGLYADHRAHVERMLASSPDVEPWSRETSLLRAGMRRSADPALRRPRAAAGLIVALVRTLTELSRRSDEMEDWFFAVLEGVATNANAVVAFASYAAALEPVREEEEEPLGQARVPIGSDQSGLEDRDPPFVPHVRDYMDDDEDVMVYSDGEVHLQ